MSSLSKLLENVLYIGKITYKHEIQEGEHSAIVDKEISKLAGSPATSKNPTVLVADIQERINKAQQLSTFVREKLETRSPRP